MKKFLTMWLHEPLFHFLILGGAIFLLYSFFPKSGGEIGDDIVVSTGQIEHLIEGWSRTWQRPPTKDELKGLVDDYVKEEILYREALSLGLDKNDTMVRRRLRQKMEFLSSDTAKIPEPTEEELKKFLQSHPEKFPTEEKFSFRHIYFNADRPSDSALANVEEVKRQWLHQKGKPDVTALGDPFPLPLEYQEVSMSEVARLFGEAFANQMKKLPTGEWAGPISSGYGIHLVLVDSYVPSPTREWPEERETVKREWLHQQQKLIEESFYQRLLSRYQIRVDWPVNLHQLAREMEAAP